MSRGSRATRKKEIWSTYNFRSVWELSVPSDYLSELTLDFSLKASPDGVLRWPVPRLHCVSVRMVLQEEAEGG